MSIRNAVVGLGMVAVLAACAGQGSPAARGYELRVRYAQITDIERVRMPSAAPAGAVVGGFTGLVLASDRSRGRQVATGIGGAALGALAVKALEGDRLGYSYRLQFADGSLSQFITEKGYMQVGDCVSVERGEYANIRRVPKTLCANGPAPAVDPTHLRDAEQCHAAKDQLLQASTDAEIEQASRKVAIICEY